MRTPIWNRLQTETLAVLSVPLSPHRRTDGVEGPERIGVFRAL